MLSTLLVAALSITLARLLWRRPVADLTVGALAAGYVNAGNLGIPIAAYVLGDVAYIAPVLMFQVLLAAPDGARRARGGHRRGTAVAAPLAAMPARNPLMIASAAGITVALAHWRIPQPLLQPFVLLGGAAVPMTLLALGMSLCGSRPLRPGPGASERWLAVGLKTLVHPLLAYLIGRHLLHLAGPALLAAVVTAALPTAQNVFIFAGRFGRSTGFARDTIVLSTAVAVVTLVAVAAGWAEPGAHSAGCSRTAYRSRGPGSWTLPSASRPSGAYCREAGKYQHSCTSASGTQSSSPPTTTTASSGRSSSSSRRPPTVSVPIVRSGSTRAFWSRT
ncbi:hypothetical protein GCM10020358_12270 [Amorphoplanes nipponensis]|uniref:AEC family transporter n=1 Tax=Actinoplanes nipponensis TaxID=135950 RepID=UPI0031F1782F